MKENKLQYIARDDGLFIQEIGLWGEYKYQLVKVYSHIFISSMRKKWGSLVYIDLFAGPGLSKIKGTNRIVMTSNIIWGNLRLSKS